MKKCLIVMTLLLTMAAPMALMADGNPNGPPPGSGPQTSLPNPTSIPVGK